MEYSFFWDFLFSLLKTLFSPKMVQIVNCDYYRQQYKLALQQRLSCTSFWLYL